MVDAEKAKHAGGCACGEVRFGFYEPIEAMVACHCRACQYVSGGGPAYMVGVQANQFRVTRGHPQEHLTLSEAGNAVTRFFCGTCGTQLYSLSEGAPEVCNVKVGCLDEPMAFKPRMHLWLSEAPRWHPLRRLTRRFSKNP